MSDPVSELKELHPIWEFFNKSGQTQTVVLADNETTQVHIRGTLKLHSNKFLNLPSTALFRFVTPTLDDLRAVGLLKIPEVKPSPIAPSPSVSTETVD